VNWLNDYRMKLVLVGFVAAIELGGKNAKADFTFGEPVNLGPPINTEVGEVPCSFSLDGLELYFDAYNRPGGYGTWDIWMSTRPTREDPWSTALNIGPPINTHSWDESPGISADGLELYFTSNRSGGSGAQDIWVSTRATRDDPWEEPVNLGAIVNGSGHECAVKVSSDSLLLLFSGDTGSPYPPGGIGQSDIWMSRRTTRDDKWNPPVNLGPLINSPYQDYAPVVSHEGDTLYFGSNRPGGLGYHDIYQAPIIPIVDFNGDGIVDALDMYTIVEHWGESYSLCDIGPMPWGDGIVDVDDLVVLSEHLFEKVDDPTLVAHWPLDEAEGTIAYDSAGVKDAVIVGGATWQPSGGQIYGALQLDGVDGCSITNPVLNPADGPFSIIAWVNGGAPGQVIVSQQGAANWLTTDANGNLMTELKGAGRSTGPLFSETVITDGNWHRIGLVWDGSNRTLYVDGIAVAEDTQDSLQGSDKGLYIGCGKAMEAGTFWSGLIDDVRIYNRVVTP